MGLGVLRLHLQTSIHRSSVSCSSSSKEVVLMKLFDAHCHLQDPRIYSYAPRIIGNALQAGVLHLAVNGLSEKDWHLVKQMSEDYPCCVIPNFGLYPCLIADRSPTWFNTLRDFLATTPSSAVGEIGLDKGPHAKNIDFADQVQVFRQQLELAKELDKPASVHCVRAYGDLLTIMQSTGPFPAGVILHSYTGSAEMVTPLAKLGAYFSFSGHNMSMKPEKAKKMLNSVPTERILLESDSPDALPRNMDSAPLVEGDDLSKELNQPANIHYVLSYISSLLEMPEEELADVSYRNALSLFSCSGSKTVIKFFL